MSVEGCGMSACTDNRHCGCLTAYEICCEHKSNELMPLYTTQTRTTSTQSRHARRSSEVSEMQMCKLTWHLVNLSGIVLQVWVFPDVELVAFEVHKIHLQHCTQCPCMLHCKQHGNCSNLCLTAIPCQSPTCTQLVVL